MNNIFNYLWSLFFLFSGEDYRIMSDIRCDTKAKNYFALVGLLVIAIFIACWFSASHFISELFEGGNKWISLPIGIFWALLVANLYLLLLYTVAPTTLPASKFKKQFRKNKNKKSKSALNASLILRLFFVSLLAIIIAQPLNVCLLKSFASKSLETYKEEYKTNLLISADSSIINKEIETQKVYYLATIAQRQYTTPNEQLLIKLLDNKVNDDQSFMNISRSILYALKKIDSVANRTSIYNSKADTLRTTLAQLIQQEVQSDDDFLNSISTTADSNSINQSQLMAFKNELTINIQDKKEHYLKIETLLNNSNFYCKQIQILLSQSPLALLITFIVVAMFIVPIRLKYIVRNKTNYYEIKSEIEKHLVLTKYQEFKKVYAEILGNKLSAYNKNIVTNLIPVLEQLKKANPQFAQKHKEEIAAETTLLAIEKYEYWQDHPFRTTKKAETKFQSNEHDLLTKIYN